LLFFQLIEVINIDEGYTNFRTENANVEGYITYIFDVVIRKLLVRCNQELADK
jgi:hypothetical protein